jgi:hypothetical protein
MLTVILPDQLVGGGKNVLQQIGSKTCHRSPCVWPNSSRAWLSTAMGPGEGTLVRYAASGRVIDRGYTILFSSALGTLAEISFSAQVVSLTVSRLRLLVADFVAKVFLGCRTKILRATGAFCAQRCEGPYRLIQNRSRTSAVALKRDAAAERSKDQLPRDF